MKSDKLITSTVSYPKTTETQIINTSYLTGKRPTIHVYPTGEPKLSLFMSQPSLTKFKHSDALMIAFTSILNVEFN